MGGERKFAAARVNVGFRRTAAIQNGFNYVSLLFLGFVAGDLAGILTLASGRKTPNRLSEDRVVISLISRAGSDWSKPAIARCLVLGKCRGSAIVSTIQWPLLVDQDHQGQNWLKRHTLSGAGRPRLLQNSPFRDAKSLGPEPVGRPRVGVYQKTVIF